MKASKNLSRRKFLGSTAATAATFSIVPAHVLARSGKIPPSDKVTVANIGCGTQGLREMSRMLQHDQLQIVAVCDPNKMSTNYVDWSPTGIRDHIRHTLEDDSWGSSLNGIPGGRDIGKDFVEKYYGKFRNDQSYRGCTAYEDYRELLANQQDLDAIKIMTPDHLHATIALAGFASGKHVITHKPIANRMKEARKTINTAKESGLKSHLLAWSDKPGGALVREWIDAGVIGELKEIHNWSYRPVWPQYMSLPQDTPPVPDGFNWDLWLGPVPHRPYHPKYTHTVFRGWYDFGGGSMADMGHYSLFPLFRALGVETAPVAAKAYGTRYRKIEDQVCRGVDNDFAYPYSCMFKLNFPEQSTLPAFDLYWYDGGMKPFAPPELEEDGLDTPEEGMMFVGDQGKILAGFRCEDPRIIPESRMNAYTGNKTMAKPSDASRTDDWVKAILEDRESDGSFIYAGPVTETINLATVALRAGKRVEYDSKELRITNDEEANQYLTRDYRSGWEI